MKLTAFLSSVFVCSVAAAVELPRASPAVRLTQTIGYTDVTVEYSSPAVRGRVIWGDLVKWDEPWRAGANDATKVTFSKDVSINNSRVAAGSYAFFVIPHKNSNWTLILNKQADQYGAGDYDAKKNAITVEVKPQAIAPRERLTYLFSNYTEDTGTLDLEWEKIRLSLPIAFDTKAQVAKELDQLERQSWHMFNEVAVYELEHRDYDAALKWVDKSLKQKEDWFNAWTKARILAARGNYREALVWADKAKELGKSWPGFKNHTDEVNAAVSEWKRKS